MGRSEAPAMLKKKFRVYDQDQQYLVPPDIRDWVHEDDFARFIDDLVRSLDLSKFEKFHETATGQPPYDPAMMLKIILHCFCNGVFSSRKMERATYSDLGVRFLAANQHPNYSSFCLFRQRHLKAIDHLFIQIVSLCWQMGLVKLGQVAIDGTIIKANASKSRNVLGEDLDELIATAEALTKDLTEKWQQADADDEKAQAEIPDKLKKAKTRLESLQNAKSVAQKHAKAAYNKKLAALESKSPEELAELAQAEEQQAIEQESGVELGQVRKHLQLSQSDLAAKTGIPQPRLSKLEIGKSYPSDEEKALLRSALHVDNICFGKPNPKLKSAKAPELKIQNFVNTTDPDSPVISRLGKGTVQGYNSQLAVDAETHIILGLMVSRNTSDHNNLLPMLDELEGTGCRNFRQLLADAGYYSKKVILELRRLGIDAYIPPDRLRGPSTALNPCPIREEMRAKVSTEQGKAARKNRSSSVEPVNGRLKTGLGFTTYLTRGVENVRSELTLCALAHNVLKMFSRWK